MKKQSWIINILLLAFAAVLVVKLRGDWMQANQRYRTLEAPASVKGASGQTTPGAIAPVAGTELIVQNNLFSADRNNNIPAPVERKAAPADPILTGALDLGSGPVALMMESAAQPVRQVRQGDLIGVFKVAKIGNNFVMVEYEGQQKRIEVQSAPRQVNAPAGASAEPARQTTSVVTVGPSTPTTAATAAAKPDPTNATGNSTGLADKRASKDMFGAGVQDNYPAGAIVNGWRKVESPWPFGGKQVWWEKVK